MQARLKVDSKGRICLPPEVREELGDVVILKKTPEGFAIIPGKPVSFIEEFRETVTSDPPRTGEP